MRVIKLYKTLARIERKSGNDDEALFFQFSREFCIFLNNSVLRFSVWGAVRSGVLHCYPTERLIKKQWTLRCDTIRPPLQRNPAFRYGIGRDTSRPYDVQEGVKHTESRCFTLYFAFFICLENRING